MEYFKPIVSTVTPALGGTVMGAIVPPDPFSVIPTLQGMAYIVSILIGIFQLCKWWRERNPLMAVKKWGAIVAKRYASPSSPIWRAVGDFAIALIPTLEAMNFSNPAWEDKRMLVHSGLIVVKFLTNLTTKKNEQPGRE